MGVIAISSKNLTVQAKTYFYSLQTASLPLFFTKLKELLKVVEAGSNQWHLAQRLA